MLISFYRHLFGLERIINNNMHSHGRICLWLDVSHFKAETVLYRFKANALAGTTAVLNQGTQCTRIGTSTNSCRMVDSVLTGRVEIANRSLEKTMYKPEEMYLLRRRRPTKLCYQVVHFLANHFNIPTHCLDASQKDWASRRTYCGGSRGRTPSLNKKTAR